MAPEQQEALWLGGGFAQSLLAPSDARSQRWRQDFIRTYLEREVPQLGPRIAAETLRRFWTMLAHHQGGLLNAASLARSLGLNGKTVASYLNLMVDLLLVRRLQPWHTNASKRLVKSPKVYVRDSGLVHALLGLGQREDLLGHPMVGASWEGFVIENILNAAQHTHQDVQASFYRSSSGAEIDLLLTWPGGRTWAIEIKRSAAPKLERGFHAACEVVQPARSVAVYPGTDAFALASGVEAMPLRGVLALMDESPK